MALAGCRALRLPRPRAAGKRLVVFVEIDRCATDAIEALCGVSLGKGTLRHVDHGKTAATFVDLAAAAAVRESAREDAREHAAGLAPAEPDARRAQVAAYQVMPDADLLRVERVVVRAERLQRPRDRVTCGTCGEGVTYRREVLRDGRPLCRACAGESYFERWPAPAATPGDPAWR
jgi:formylmethanofuran dehydrogenase subunit E